MSELTNNKTEIGQENVYYEMEYKGENEDGTYEKVIVKNESPQERLRERAQPYKDPEEVKSRYFLFVVTAIAIASLLTAAATMVLAFAMTNSRSDVSTTRESCRGKQNKTLIFIENIVFTILSPTFAPSVASRFPLCIQYVITKFIYLPFIIDLIKRDHGISGSLPLT